MQLLWRFFHNLMTWTKIGKPQISFLTALITNLTIWDAPETVYEKLNFPMTIESDRNKFEFNICKASAIIN